MRTRPHGREQKPDGAWKVLVISMMDGSDATVGYAYGHAWAMERVRLAGLEATLDPGTREHLTRLGAGPGKRCLEVGAGGGSVALWLAGQVAPGGTVVATDLENRLPGAGSGAAHRGGAAPWHG